MVMRENQGDRMKELQKALAKAFARAKYPTLIEGLNQLILINGNISVSVPSEKGGAFELHLDPYKAIKLMELEKGLESSFTDPSVGARREELHNSHFVQFALLEELEIACQFVAKNKGALDTVLWESTPEGGRIVGCNGAYLYVKELNQAPSDIMFPARVITLARKIGGKTAKIDKISWNDLFHEVTVKSDNGAFAIRWETVTGQYPGYRFVMVKDPLHTVKVKPSYILDACKQAKRIGGKDAIIAFNMEGYAYTSVKGIGLELVGDLCANLAFNVAFNANVLETALKPLKNSLRCVVEYNHDVSAFQFIGEATTTVAMPWRLSKSPGFESMVNP
jgi:hypothetical protein